MKNSNYIVFTKGNGAYTAFLLYGDNSHCYALKTRRGPIWNYTPWLDKNHIK